MAKSSGPITPTKKHLARQERESLQTRYLIIGTAVVLVSVLALLLYGFLQQNVFLPVQAVAKVGGETITLAQFQARVRFERSQLVNQYVNYYSLLESFADSPELTSSIQGSLQQILIQLDPTTMGRTVLNTMIDEVLIRQEAERRGITVTDEEVRAELARQFGFQPDGATQEPTATSFPTPFATSTLSPQQLELITPVPTVVITPTATSAPTATPDAAFTPTATAAPTEAPTATPTSAPTASPTPYTEDAYKSDYQETLGNLRNNLQFSEQDLLNLIRAQLYRTHLYDLLTADVPVSQEQVWARHILVADLETAEQVRAELTQGGDFGNLALQYSTDTASGISGGDLGWFGKGMMLEEFETAAFSLEIGEISEPVQTLAGYHIIQVLGKEPRALDSSEYSQAQDAAFSEWLLAERERVGSEIFDIWADNIPEEPAIPDTMTAI